MICSITNLGIITKLSDGVRKPACEKSLRKVKEPSALPFQIVMICGRTRNSDIFWDLRSARLVKFTELKLCVDASTCKILVYILLVNRNCLRFYLGLFEFSLISNVTMNHNYMYNSKIWRFEGHLLDERVCVIVLKTYLCFYFVTFYLCNNWPQNLFPRSVQVRISLLLDPTWTLLGNV